MGADLILTWIEVPDEPNYEAMLALIASATEEDFERLGDEGFRYDEGQEGPAFWSQCVNQLEQLVEVGGSRESSVLEIGGGRPVLITGGISWGDTPTEEGELIDHLWAWPELLWAGGFGNSTCMHCKATIWPDAQGGWGDAGNDSDCVGFANTGGATHEPTASAP